MARINIDDQFWVEVMPLVASLGNQDLALGQALRFFRLAQEKHKHGKLVSEEDFSRAGFSESLIGVFADRVDGGIQAIGAQKHFGWLAKRVEAGRKGGSTPKQIEAKQSKPKQPEASPSYSPSYSSSPSSSPSPLKEASNSANSTKAGIAAYCERYKLRWGLNPPIQGKDTGIMKRLVKSFSPDKLSLYLDAYFQMPDAGIVKAKHPLNFFEMKMNEVVVFAESGQFTTTTQARQADNMATNHLLMEKLKREGK